MASHVFNILFKLAWCPIRNTSSDLECLSTTLFMSVHPVHCFTSWNSPLIGSDNNKKGQHNQTYRRGKLDICWTVSTSDYPNWKKVGTQKKKLGQVKVLSIWQTSLKYFHSEDFEHMLHFCRRERGKGTGGHWQSDRHIFLSSWHSKFHYHFVVSRWLQDRAATISKDIENACFYNI